MIINIFTNIWSKLTEITNQFYEFIMSNYDEPFLWITILVFLLTITYWAISNLANK